MTVMAAATFDDDFARDEGRACARGPRCASAVVDPESGMRFAAVTPRPLCDADRDLLEVVIGQMPRIYVRVHQALLVANAGSAGPKVATSRTPPILLNQNADELLRLMMVILVSWEERVRDVARLIPLDTRLSRQRRDGVAVQQAVQVLVPRVAALIALDAEPMTRDGLVVDMDGADAALELFHLHWRCRATLQDTNAPARPLSTPCRCGLRQLVEIVDWEDRPDGAKCRACQRSYSEREVADLTREMTERARGVQASRPRPSVMYGDESGRA